MSSLGVIQTTVSTEVASTSTSFTEVAETDALVDGKTYYVVCHGLVEGTNNSKVFQWRLVDRTNGDAVLSNSTQIREVTQANVTQAYQFVGRFTAGSDGGGLAFEQKSFISQTVRTQYLSLMLLDVDNLTSDDFFYTNNTTDTELTNSFQDFATTTKSNITANDDWLVFAWQATATDDVGTNTEMKLFCSDATGTENEPLLSFEGEDLTEVLGWWVCRAYTMSGAGTTWTVKSRMDATTANPNNHIESTLFGLRLSAFENHAQGYVSSELATSSTAWQELNRRTLTPDTSGDVIVVASSIFDGDSTTRKSYQRVQVDGVTSPNSRPDYEYAANLNDFSSLIPLAYITKYSGVADTLVSIDLDAKKESSAIYGWLQYTLAAFTAKIKSTAPVRYSPVATQTFTSGDVASQAYNGGDVASETFNSGDVASEVNPE